MKRADVVNVNYLFSKDTGKEGVGVIPSCFLPENNPRNYLFAIITLPVSK